VTREREEAEKNVKREDTEKDDQGERGDRKTMMTTRE